MVTLVHIDIISLLKFAGKVTAANEIAGKTARKRRVLPTNE